MTAPTPEQFRLAIQEHLAVHPEPVADCLTCSYVGRTDHLGCWATGERPVDCDVCGRKGRSTTPGADVDAMLARGVRAKHVAYAEALLDALRSGVPARALVEWGIPAVDVQDASERLDLPTPPARTPSPDGPA